MTLPLPKLLEEFTAFAEARFQATYDEVGEKFAWGNEIAQPYILHDHMVVLPPYFDGHMGFRMAALWVNNHGTLSAVNSFGEVRSFGGIDHLSAFTFLMEV